MRIFCLAVPALLVGCTTSTPQVLTGRIEANFPSPITTVEVTTTSIESWHGNALVTRTVVAADGSFRVEIPPMTGVQLHLIAESGRSTLVFPRQTGTVAKALAIRAEGVAFDLGRIRYVGNAAALTYAFSTAGAMDPGCADEGRDSSGAVCVDDSDDDHNTCGQDDSSQQEGDHQDGGDGQGDHQDGETQDDGGQADMGDAVAEHNFPSDGCADDHGRHQDGEHTDGNDGAGGGD